MRKATEQKKTRKERTAMKKIKILTVMLAVMLAGVCVFGGCASGTLYSLEELYAAGEIDKEDLLNIAYHNGDSARNEEAMQGFEPTPIGELDEKISKKCGRAWRKITETMELTRRRRRRTSLFLNISVATTDIMPPAFRLIFMLTQMYI